MARRPVFRILTAPVAATVAVSTHPQLPRPQRVPTSTYPGRIPVLVKDDVDTRSMQTAAGSRALRGKPTKDATPIRRPRDAGAVLPGKANLSEWANFHPAKPTSGWSGVGGQTNNPDVLDRNPCGSSTGSAASVARPQIAIGSETDGASSTPAAVAGHPDVTVRAGISFMPNGGWTPAYSPTRPTSNASPRSGEPPRYRLAAGCGWFTAADLRRWR